MIGDWLLFAMIGDWLLFAVIGDWLLFAVIGDWLLFAMIGDWLVAVFCDSVRCGPLPLPVAFTRCLYPLPLPVAPTDYPGAKKTPCPTKNLTSSQSNHHPIR